MEPFDDRLADDIRAALEIPGVVSAVVFVRTDDAASLRLAAAAGIEGEPLRRLSAAVLSPAHPIAQTLADATASFDVLPTAPGGPVFRSHLPILVERDGRIVSACAGVLAVAHDPPLDAESRAALAEIARRVARSLA